MEERHIFILEDELDLAEALQFKLQSKGYVVKTVADGRLALEQILSLRPDLVLLDIIVPNMDGLAVLRALREDKWGKGAKVFMLTNKDTGESLEEAQSLGANFFIKSNESLDNLVEKIEEALK